KPSAEFQDLLKKLLEKDPSKRLDWCHLIHHPFWRGQVEIVLKQFLVNNSRDGRLSDTLDTSVGNHGNREIYEAPPTFEEEDHSVCQSSSACDTDESIVEQLESSVSCSPGATERKSFKPKTPTVGSTALGEALFTLSTRSSINVTPMKHSTTVPQPGSPPGYLDEVLPYTESKTRLLELLYHPTDFNVTPIADNPRITKVVPFKYETKSLPIVPHGAEKMLTLPDKSYEKHISQIIEVTLNVEKGPASQKRHNFINYIGTLVSHSTIANSLVNRGMLLHLAKLVKDCNHTDMRCKLSRVAAILVNSTTEIDDAVNISEPITTFSELLRDNLKNAKLRHSLLPVVGELLFLVACQENQRGETIENWSVPTMTHTIIAKCCREEGDIITNHLAAKIIENVTTTFGHHALKFATTEIGQSLWYLYKQTAIDSLQITVLLALCRITRLSVNVFQNVVDSVGVATLVHSCTAGIARIQQAVITMFGALLTEGLSVPRLLQDK
ncbi:hypothetical protein Ahia01_000861600, partial [Argonauta hians]